MVKDNYIFYLLKFKLDMDAFKEPDVPKMGLASFAAWGTSVLSALLCEEEAEPREKPYGVKGQQLPQPGPQHTGGAVLLWFLSRGGECTGPAWCPASETQVAPLSYVGRATRRNALKTPQTSLRQEWRLESGKINIS